MCKMYTCVCVYVKYLPVFILISQALYFRESRKGLETFQYNTCLAEISISGKSHEKPNHSIS